MTLALLHLSMSISSTMVGSIREVMGGGRLADLILFFCTLKVEIFNVCCVFFLLFGDNAWVYFFLSFNLLGKLCFAFAQPLPSPITFLMVQLLHTNGLRI